MPRFFRFDEDTELSITEKTLNLIAQANEKALQMLREHSEQ